MILDDLGQLLQTAGVGALGSTLFLTFMPAAPDVCVALVEYGGSMGVHRMSALPGTAVVEYPSVQVTARSLDPEQARSLIEQAYRALDGYHGTVNNTRYGWIVANQPPFQIHRDQNDRVVMGFNVSVTKTLSA